MKLRNDTIKFLQYLYTHKSADAETIELNANVKYISVIIDELRRAGIKVKLTQVGCCGDFHLEYSLDDHDKLAPKYIAEHLQLAYSYGKIYPINTFMQCVDSGELTDFKGTGRFITEDGIELFKDKVICDLSYLKRMRDAYGYQFIVWFSADMDEVEKIIRERKVNE